MWVRDFHGAGLAAVGITEGEVNAGLSRPAAARQSYRQRDVGAERELADAVAERVGVAVVPELPFHFLPRASAETQPAVGDLQRQWRWCAGRRNFAPK